MKLTSIHFYVDTLRVSASSSFIVWRREATINNELYGDLLCRKSCT